MTMIAEMAAAPVRDGPGRRGWLGNRDVVAVARATAVLALVAVPLLVLVPGAAKLVPLALSTLWMRGPFAGFIPIGLEPVLMAYGTIYPPWLVTVVAAAASAYAEFVSQHMMRGVVALPRLDRLAGRCRNSRVMQLFNRRPALAIAVTALSPIPDCITRTLAALSRYSIARYVTADTVGRLPKLFIPAAVGAALHIPTVWLVGTCAGSLGIGVAVAMWKWWRARSRRIVYATPQ